MRNAEKHISITIYREDYELLKKLAAEWNRTLIAQFHEVLRLAR